MFFCHPSASKPFRLGGDDPGARGDDEEVVGQYLTAGEADFPLLRIHDIDLGDDEVDPGRDEPAPGLLHVPGLVDAEGNEEESRLVDVGVVLIYDRDLPLIQLQGPGQLCGHHRAGGSAPEYQDLFHSCLLRFRVMDPFRSGLSIRQEACRICDICRKCL